MAKRSREETPVRSESLFGKLVENSLYEIPDRRNRELAKMEIHQVLFKYQFQVETPQYSDSIIHREFTPTTSNVPGYREPSTTFPVQLLMQNTQYTPRIRPANTATQRFPKRGSPMETPESQFIKCSTLGTAASVSQNDDVIPQSPVYLPAVNQSKVIPSTPVNFQTLVKEARQTNPGFDYPENAAIQLGSPQETRFIASKLYDSPCPTDGKASKHYYHLESVKSVNHGNDEGFISLQYSDQ